jgi:hypothetical protein
MYTYNQSTFAYLQLPRMCESSPKLFGEEVIIEGREGRCTTGANPHSPTCSSSVGVCTEFTYVVFEKKKR